MDSSFKTILFCLARPWKPIFVRYRGKSVKVALISLIVKDLSPLNAKKIATNSKMSICCYFFGVVKVAANSRKSICCLIFAVVEGMIILNDFLHHGLYRNLPKPKS